MRPRTINIPRSITSVLVNGQGHLIVQYKDGSTMDAGYVIGPPGQGQPGNDGVGIASGTVDAAGNLILTLTSGAKITGNLSTSLPSPVAIAL